MYNINIMNMLMFLLMIEMCKSKNLNNIAWEQAFSNFNSHTCHLGIL